MFTASRQRPIRRPDLVIEHSLHNTGRMQIPGAIQPTFLTLDGTSIGPDFASRCRSKSARRREMKLAAVQGMRFASFGRWNRAISSAFPSTASAKQGITISSLIIERQALGYEPQHRPMTKLALWSIRSVLSMDHLSMSAPTGWPNVWTTT